MADPVDKVDALFVQTASMPAHFVQTESVDAVFVQTDSAPAHFAGE